MSTGGALLTIHDLSASIHLQPAYVVIKTPVSFRNFKESKRNDRLHLRTCLSLVHQELCDFLFTERRTRPQWPRSLLDGLQDGSTIVTFEGLILPLFTTAANNPDAPLPSTAAPTDSREAARLNVPCPIRLVGSSATPTRPLGVTVNLSLDGACIGLPGGSDFPENQQVLHLVPVEPNTSSIGAALPEGSETPWPCADCLDTSISGQDNLESRSTRKESDAASVCALRVYRPRRSRFRPYLAVDRHFARSCRTDVRLAGPHRFTPPTQS